MGARSVADDPPGGNRAARSHTRTFEEDLA